MTTELVLHNDSLSDKIEYAKALAPAAILPATFKGNPANLLWAIEYADALGISRMNAITSIHVINGKPSASAELIAGLVRRDGHKLRVSGDDKSATAQIIRKDDPDFTYEAVWTIERARAAGLTGKDTWKNYPAAMLRARAITEVARAACSEALLGLVYTPEELADEPRDITATTEVSAPKPAAERIRSLIINADTGEAFDAKTGEAVHPEDAETLDVEVAS